MGPVTTAHVHVPGMLRERSRGGYSVSGGGRASAIYTYHRVEVVFDLLLGEGHLPLQLQIEDLSKKVSVEMIHESLPGGFRQVELNWSGNLKVTYTLDGAEVSGP